MFGLIAAVSCAMSIGVSDAVAKATTTKSLTQAQKLSKALKACKKKPKMKRAVCRSRAKRKYATHQPNTLVPAPATTPPASTTTPTAPAQPSPGQVGAATAPVAPVAPTGGAQYYHFLGNMPLTACNNVITGTTSTDYLELEFHAPDDVRSLYPAEWVYFRPIEARADGAGYGYGQWQRGLATPTGLSYVTSGAFLFKSQWTTEDGLEARYAAFLNLPAGLTYYVGYQINWSVSGYTDTQWPFVLYGACR
jgi:hypothetical protein